MVERPFTLEYQPDLTLSSSIFEKNSLFFLVYLLLKFGLLRSSTTLINVYYYMFFHLSSRQRYEFRDVSVNHIFSKLEFKP